MSPDFANKEAAMAYAEQVLDQLKAAGYAVTLEVAGLDEPPAAAQAGESNGAQAVAGQTAHKKKIKGKKQAAKGETDSALAAWLSVAGSATPAAEPATGDPVPDDPSDHSLAPTLGVVVPPPLDPQDVSGDHLVTPLGPDLFAQARQVGAAGKPLLVGGEDLEDMSATVVVYRGYGPHKDKEWPVVWCKVRPEAEDKIMAAIAAAQGVQFITVTKEIEMNGRAPFDEAQDVAGQIVKYAKSINHHVKEGTPVPEHTLTGVAELQAYLAQAAEDPALSEGERQILAVYQEYGDELAGAIQAGTQTPRKNYAGITGPHVRRVQEQVPVPVDPAAGPGLTVQVREGTRLNADEAQGLAYWDGKKRLTGYGKEIAIDFGGGWGAVYHPHAKDYHVPWSYQGTLEIHAPAGADPRGISEHLQRLYIQGAPMSRPEAEAIYLERNAWAQGLTGDPGYRAIQQYTSLRRQDLAAELALAGDFAPDDAGMAAAVLQAERKVLPEKVALLRRLFEQNLGLPEGTLASHPRYRPEPIWEPAHHPAAALAAEAGTPGGQFVWHRFDVDPAEVKGLFGKRVLGHHLSGDKLENLKRIILGGGILAAQEKRWQMGAKPHGSTMSPGQDQHSGGAAYIFLRVSTSGKSEFDIEWEPASLLERSDWFFRNEDNFGAVNPHDSHYHVAPSTELAKAAKATASNNEIVFKHGIGLFGRHAPRRIRVGPAHRPEVLGWFQQAGVTHLGGRPVEEVVV